jgi:two-component system sensor histidine kinase KdpD
MAGTSPKPVGPQEGSVVPHESMLPQYILAVSIVLGITLPAYLIQPFVGYRAIALIYLLGVVLMALFVGQGPTLLAAAMSALFWDFFFIKPIPTLRIGNAEDAILFGMYFVVALVLGQLTSRIRAQQKAESQREARSTALYRLTKEMVAAMDADQLVARVVAEVGAAFEARVVVLLPDASQLLKYYAHPASTYEITGPEQPIVEYAFAHQQAAGKFTHGFPTADALFIPLTTEAVTVGVLGLCFGPDFSPARSQISLIAAFGQQIALALDRQRLRTESEKAKLLAESERLSQMLLNSMSHEIRTPLAAIKSAAQNLAEFKETQLAPAQQAMISELLEGTDRLNRLVSKVLDVTRLESGNLKPRLTLCDVPDLVHMAIKETRRELTGHKLSVELAPALPWVRADFVLLQQALINLLSNAALHTPPGTSVQVSARVRDHSLVLAVADRGPGIPAAALPRIFEKFYRAPGATTGGTGLGLSLVKGFVEIQGGSVQAENRLGGGAVFTISLPLAHSA